MKKRIYKVLVSSGFIESKKHAEFLIKNEQIKVNNKLVNSLNYFVDTKKDVITLNNKILKEKKEKIYLLLNKPKGIETTKENILKFLKIKEELKNTVFPIGRLDKESEGLLILTNDGSLTEILMHPTKHVEKTYLITAEKEITDEQLKLLENGIEIQMEENNQLYKYQTKPCKITKIKQKVYQIIITEGKKRQVRRMLEAVNNKVISLTRIKIGKIELNLKPGEYKTVTKEFILSSI